jgi:hypothetical protein
MASVVALPETPFLLALRLMGEFVSETSAELPYDFEAASPEPDMSIRPPNGGTIAEPPQANPVAGSVTPLQAILAEASQKKGKKRPKTVAERVVELTGDPTSVFQTWCRYHHDGNVQSMSEEEKDLCSRIDRCRDDIRALAATPRAKYRMAPADQYREETYPFGERAQIDKEAHPGWGDKWPVQSADGRPLIRLWIDNNSDVLHKYFSMEPYFRCAKIDSGDVQIQFADELTWIDEHKTPSDLKSHIRKDCPKETSFPEQLARMAAFPLDMSRKGVTYQETEHTELVQGAKRNKGWFNRGGGGGASGGGSSTDWQKRADDEKREWHSTTRTLEAKVTQGFNMRWRRTQNILDSVLTIYKDIYACLEYGQYYYDQKVAGKDPTAPLTDGDYRSTIHAVKKKNRTPALIRVAMYNQADRVSADVAAAIETNTGSVANLVDLLRECDSDEDMVLLLTGMNVQELTLKQSNASSPVQYRKPDRLMAANLLEALFDRPFESKKPTKGRRSRKNDHSPAPAMSEDDDGDGPGLSGALGSVLGNRRRAGVAAPSGTATQAHASSREASATAPGSVSSSSAAKNASIWKGRQSTIHESTKPHHWHRPGPSIMRGMTGAAPSAPSSSRPLFAGQNGDDVAEVSSFAATSSRSSSSTSHGKTGKSAKWGARDVDESLLNVDMSRWKDYD